MGWIIISIFCAFAIISNVQAETKPIACADMKIIVDLHTKYRLDVAAGKVKPLPGSKELGKLVWSDTLAESAIKRMNVIVGDKNFNPKFAEQDGQGTSILVTTEGTPTQQRWKSVVDKWNDEHKVYKYAKFSPFAPGHHFSQMIWANSIFIGCSFNEKRFAKDNKLYKIYLCKYETTGNIPGLFPYDTSKLCGIPCSNVKGLPSYGNKCK